MLSRCAYHITCRCNALLSSGCLHLQLCMLCSVGYHLFCCHRSEKTSRRWMALDYAGVSIGILGCYVPGVFYTFYCNNVRALACGPLLRLTYANGSDFVPCMLTARMVRFTGYFTLQWIVLDKLDFIHLMH